MMCSPPHRDFTYAHHAQVTWDLDSPASISSSAGSSSGSLVYFKGLTRFMAEGTVNKAVSGQIWQQCVAAPQQVTVPLARSGNNVMDVNSFTVAGPLYRAYHVGLPAFVTEEATYSDSCGERAVYIWGTEFTPPEAPPFATIAPGGNVIEDEGGTHGRDDYGLSAWRFTSLSEP